ncbi:branched-chain amino acid ABC transporter permease [Sulfitobacter alexandrii]|uniref:Branched-chain amino acid ABC transporter permease n=1 Tax=Sulfitobacter alexandrii TaxID=1917485 RepID=A0A1J0WGT2_9RHOB|nr:branched-chain amino acid ABC transporter permease [Sulfitobacter alexandrii]APE43515.1 branched-chain amino acid ABC transporter permease [Sulfitobacter alexandrii]
MSSGARSTLLHLGLIALLFVLAFALPSYHQGNLARIMVLATYAIGYNVLFGYAGLLSLGHAMFFGAGMYGLGLAMQYGGLGVIPAFAVGLICAAVLSTVVALLALRTIGVAFMIVTLMFAQAGYLTVLYFGAWTRGDEGFVIAQSARAIGGLDLTDPTTRYLAALVLFSAALLITARMMQVSFGSVLIGVRENEERTRMLGYDVFRHKLAAVVISGTISGAAGAGYAVLFGYVGATFTSVQYSIFPLLWVLLGGAGTTIGPLVGTLFMFYLIDYSSGLTNAYMLIAGVVLVLLTLFARAGLVGEIRKRWVAWLP